MTFHITSEELQALEIPNNQPQIGKIEPNQVYLISNKKNINTKYGKKTILIAEGGKSYWAPSNMIRLFMSFPELYHFRLTTKDIKTYKSQSGVEYQAPEFVIDSWE